jgi:hypothetical protein
MNCAQVKEQLVDFLYEELPASARSAFAEHLRGCPGCRAEVASYQTTVGQARKALTGPLLEEPPARAHAAALAAAHAAAQKARKGEQESGILARFWRTPWLLPAFGAVSVATVVFLVRVLKNPEIVPGQEGRAIDERAVVTPVPAAPPTPAPPGEPAMAAPTRAAPAAAAVVEERAAATAETAKVGSHKARRALRSGAKGEAPAFETARPRPGLDLEAPLGGLRGNATAGGAGTGRFAEPPPPRPAAKASRSIDDLLGEVGSARKPAAAPAEGSPAAAERKAAPRDYDELADHGRQPSVPQAAAKKAKADKEVAEPARRPSIFAAPPPPMAAPAAAPAPSSPPPAASAPARAATPASKDTRRREMEEEMAPAESAAQPAERQQAREKAPAGKGGPSLEESAKKADRLFADGAWSAAAAAYRDLLDRFPTYKDAPKWRERLNQSVVAMEAARKASDAKASKAAKAKSNDVLLKEMK